MIILYHHRYRRLFDELALTEATARAKAVSLDAGRPGEALKHVSFSGKAETPSLPEKPSGNQGSPVGSPRRGTSPGVMLTGDFGFKPQEAPKEEEPTASPRTSGRDGAGDGRGSPAPRSTLT